MPNEYSGPPIKGQWTGSNFNVKGGASGINVGGQKLYVAAGGSANPTPPPTAPTPTPTNPTPTPTTYAGMIRGSDLEKIYDII